MKKVLLIIICSIAICSAQAQVEKPTYVGSAPAYFDIFTKPSISFNYNSTLLCFSEKIGTVTFYNIMNETKTTYTLGKESTVVICLFHPTKEEIVIGCKDGSVTIYDYAKQTVIKTMQAHPKSITAATYSTYGDTLYTAGKEDKINVWNSNGDLIKTFETASSAKTIHIRGSQVIYNNEKMMNCIRIIDFNTAKEKKIDVSTAMKMDVSKDGKRAYVNCLSAEVEVWNLISGSMEYKLIGHKGHGEDAVLSANEKMVLSGGDDNNVIVWDVEKQKEAWLLDLKSDVYCICISPDDRYFAVLTNEQKMHFYKTNTSSPTNPPILTPAYKTPPASTPPVTTTPTSVTTTPTAAEVTYPTDPDEYCYVSVWKYNKRGRIDYEAYYFSVSAPKDALQNEIKEFYRKYAEQLAGSGFQIIEEYLVYQADCQECKKTVNKKYVVSNFQVNRMKMPNVDAGFVSNISDVDVKFLKADRKYGEGKYTESRKLIEEYIKESQGKFDPNFAPYVYLASCYSNEKDYENAIINFKKDLEYDNKRSLGYLAAVYALKGDSENALLWLEKKQNSGNPYSLEAALNDKDFASLYNNEKFKKIMQEDKRTTFKKRVDSCDYYVAKSDLTMAVKMIEEAIAADPNNPGGYHGKGIILVKQKNLAAALKEFQKENELESSASFSGLKKMAGYQQLGQVQRDMGDNVNASLNTEKAIKGNKTNYPGYMDLAVMFSKQGKYREAKNVMLDYIRIANEDEFGYYMLSIIWGNLGDITQKKQYAQKAIDLFKVLHGTDAPKEYYDQLK